MEYVQLGRSGLRVSQIALGGFSFGDPNFQSWMLPEEASRPIIRRALELGINYIDTSDRYSHGVSEEIIGRAWSEFARRENLVLSTKVWWPTGPGPNEHGLSRKHIFDAIDASLKRLKTDYVDIYLSHRRDFSTPFEETCEAFHDVVKSGKARYLGVSNMMAWEVMRIMSYFDQRGWMRPIVVQNHYNLAYREEEREMLPLCIEERIGLTPWSPLARGFLAGKRVSEDQEQSKRSQADRYMNVWFGSTADLAVVDALQKVAEKMAVPMAQVALAWLLSRQGVAAPVIGATKALHVDGAVAAARLKLDAADIELLEAPYQPKPILLHR